MRALLENGADPYLPDAAGATPLQLALVKGQREIIAMFVERNVATPARTMYGYITAVGH